jgi:hypothetical protein
MTYLKTFKDKPGILYLCLAIPRVAVRPVEYQGDSVKTLKVNFSRQIIVFYMFQKYN